MKRWFGLPYVLSGALGLGLVACGDDNDADDAAPTSFSVKIENVTPYTQFKSGSFNTPKGTAEAGPLEPGGSYEFSFTAAPGHRLFFATMFVQSNDWFFAPEPEGIPLYNDDGVGLTGDVTSMISIYDAGTELDEEPGVGLHTAPKQADSTDGLGATDPDTSVREVATEVVIDFDTNSDFELPAVSAMIKVVIAHDADQRMFTVTLTNMSNTNTLDTSAGPMAVVVSPGVWTVVEGDAEPVFTEGEPDRGYGLEALAEAGDPSALSAYLDGNSGVATAMSPGIWVVHSGDAPLFEKGMQDRGEGIMQIAEMGNPDVLAAALEAMLPTDVTSYGKFSMPVGASDPGAIHPGESYMFSVTAVPGDRLTFVTMFGASNDWFFAPLDTGIPLFVGTTAVQGDVTDKVRIWDAGTELDEEPGVGAHNGAPEGPADTDTDVRMVVPDDDFSGTAMEYIKVTLSK